MRPPGEHREVQQPPLRQEQERRLRSRGQLPAERAGPARGAARGLPLQLRDVAGERGLLAAHPVGGAATESIRGRREGGENVVLGRVLAEKVKVILKSRIEERGKVRKRSRGL